MAHYVSHADTLDIRKPLAHTHAITREGAIYMSRLRIVTMKKTANAWWFHLHVHNNTSRRITFLNQQTSHYFVLGGQGTENAPYTFAQLTVKLVPPAQAEASAYSAISPTVAGGGDGDGWLVADLTHFKYKPFQLLYVYGTVTTPACSNPRDQSACHPSTGYRTLVWSL